MMKALAQRTQDDRVESLEQALENGDDIPEPHQRVLTTMKSRTDKRLDDIERNLTPRQWVIWLAAKIRCYPSRFEFDKSIAKGTYRESPFVRPLLALQAQAEDRHSGRRPEDVSARQQLSRELRMQYWAFANLMYIAQDEAEEIRTKSRKSIRARDPARAPNCSRRARLPRWGNRRRGLSDEDS